MRTNKRFLFTLAIIGCWTLLTYVIVIRNHSDYQNGKSKFREKIVNLEKEIDVESHNRESIIRQYKNLVNIVRSKEATPSAAPQGPDSNLAPLEDENVNNPVQLNNKIDFNGKYVEDDVNRPVIPVLVFSCNRVSVSRNLDLLIKYRPSRQQFPIIVSQVKSNYQLIMNSFAYRLQLLLIRRTVAMRLPAK